MNKDILFNSLIYIHMCDLYLLLNNLRNIPIIFNTHCKVVLMGLVYNGKKKFYFISYF